jgi:hypothetical protein
MAVKLVAAADDACQVVARVLSTAALVCSTLLVCSFGLFAYTQVAHGSAHQAGEIVGGAAQPATSVHQPASQPKRFIDAAASALRSPFGAVVQSDDPWVRIGIPTLLALLVYGFGLGFLARFARSTTLSGETARVIRHL